MYLIIGSGRAALHFSSYLRFLNVQFLQWNRKQNSLEDLKNSLSRTSKALILISDSQIQSFSEEFLSSFQGEKIHFSGALEIPGLKSVHPLMSFGPKPYELADYEKIYFAVSPETDFKKLFPELKNHSFKLQLRDKALYHAWAAFSGNLAALLWKESLPNWKQLGVPPEAIEFFLKKTLESSIQDPLLAPTGAIVRNDEMSLQKHLSVLPSKARELYQKFIEVQGNKI